MRLQGAPDGRCAVQAGASKPILVLAPIRLRVPAISIRPFFVFYVGGHWPCNFAAIPHASGFHQSGCGCRLVNYYWVLHPAWHITLTLANAYNPELNLSMQSISVNVHHVQENCHNLSGYDGLVCQDIHAQREREKEMEARQSVHVCVCV